MKRFVNLFLILCWSCLLSALFFMSINQVPTSRALRVSTSPIPSWLKTVILINIILICLLMLFLSESPRIKRNSKIRLTCKAFGIVVPWLSVMMLMERLLTDISIRTMGRIFGGIMLCLIVALLIVLCKYSKQLYNHKTATIWEVALLFLAIIGCTLWMPYIWGLTIPQITLSGSLLEYYIGQLSLTFITISVMSMLSDKSVIIYWENVSEAKLIKPLFGSFASYTAYSISATVGAGISVILNNAFAFIVFFVLNILVLIFLTLTMVDVYYGRESKKRVLAQKLHTSVKEYENKYVSMRSRSTFDIDDKISSNKLEYQDIMHKLLYHLYQAIQEHNIPYVCEIAELYGGNMDCFDTAEGKEVKELLKSAPVETSKMMIDGLNIKVVELEHKHDLFNALNGGEWKEDVELWKMVLIEEHLDYLINDASNVNKLSKIVLDRLTLLFNDIVSNARFRGYNFNPKYLMHKEYYFTSINPQTLDKIFCEYNSKLIEQSDLIACLVNIVVILLKKADDSTIKLFALHPMVKFLTKYLAVLGLNEKDISFWKKRIAFESDFF